MDLQLASKCHAFLLVFILFMLSFADMLSTCHLHFSLTRTAQIYLELQFCVELHTKNALLKSTSSLKGTLRSKLAVDS